MLTYKNSNRVVLMALKKEHIQHATLMCLLRLKSVAGEEGLTSSTNNSLIFCRLTVTLDLLAEVL